MAIPEDAGDIPEGWSDTVMLGHLRPNADGSITVWGTVQGVRSHASLDPKDRNTSREARSLWIDRKKSV